MSMPNVFMYQFRQMKPFQVKAFKSSCTLQPEVINVLDRMELQTGRVGWAVSIEKMLRHPSEFLTSFINRLFEKALTCY